MEFYHHFTVSERESLHILRNEGKSMREIAKKLGKSCATISREIARNKNKDGSYNAWRATILYICRRKKCKRRLLLEQDRELNQWVCERLSWAWTPEEIAARRKLEYAGSTLSHTTIYSALRRGLLPHCAPKTHLRRRGKRRNHHRANYNTIHPDRLIRDWPKAICERLNVGDWEGDTVYGAVGKGLISTAVDRKSRLLVAALLHSRNGGETNAAMIKALDGHVVNSLSLDNGSEFSQFRELEKALNTTIYFADPHAPWQRGSNENTNGILRFFFPKGTNFHNVTQEQLDYVVALINNRPRKCLHWLSPIEFLQKCCT